VQRQARLETKEWTERGTSVLTKERAAAEGTMTSGKTRDKGFKPGKVMAIDGRPGSIDNHVEQTLAKGCALRPESARVAEVVNDRMAEAVGKARRADGTIGGRVGASDAVQLVKTTWLVESARGSMAGGEVDSEAENELTEATGLGTGSAHLVAWAGKEQGS
jgi:hypothetical protein